MQQKSGIWIAGGFAAAALITWGQGAANAAIDPYFAAFVVPAWYGQADTTYQEWSTFSSLAGPNAAVSVSNANGTPNAYNATAASDGSFLTGGHIYSPSGIIHPVIIVPEQNKGAGYTTRLILQIETLGSEIDASTLQVTPDGGSVVAPSSIDLLSQTPLGGFGGFKDDYQFVWNLPGNASAYRFAFNSSDPSLSWAGARVDSVVAVPEPASIASVVLGGSCLLLCRRRQLSACS
jgi:hypothetical protein